MFTIVHKCPKRQTPLPFYLHRAGKYTFSPIAIGRALDCLNPYKV